MPSMKTVILHTLYVLMQTPAEHEAMYLDRVENSTYFVNVPLAGISYDTIWALAKALNKTQGMVDSGNISESGCEETPGELVDLNNFNYSNGLMGCIIRWSLAQTNFTGVVVCLFSSENNRISIVCKHFSTLVRDTFSSST